MKTQKQMVGMMQMMLGYTIHFCILFDMISCQNNTIVEKKGNCFVKLF